MAEPKAPRDPASFEMLAPLLDRAERRDPVGVQRAQSILWELDRLLSACSGEVSAGLPDARWRQVCEGLLEDEQLGPCARSIVDGFAWFDGTYVPPTVTPVELGEGDDPPFPLFVAGFGIQNSAKSAMEHAGAGAPPGLAVFSHQYGGYACLQATWVGYAFRVSPSFGASKPLQRLLRAWFETHGDAMSEPDLLEWHARLCEIMDLPRLTRGAEALLESIPCAPLQFVRHQPVIGFRPRKVLWKGVDFSMSGNAEILTLEPYGEAHEQALFRIGEYLALGPPRMALLWGNSD